MIYQGIGGLDKLQLQSTGYFSWKKNMKDVFEKQFIYPN